MADPSVVFDGVWKKYRKGERHNSLRDLVPALVKRAAFRGDRGLRDQEFWAVRDVSFGVGSGQTLGIIGRNGAGKSTILKLLTRIIRPTAGRCYARGRVGALVEIAAGFHPDLTGRENIFLQGAIMGMARDAIKGSFDDIVDFSGLADFIDTPVKRYSSGMNARLGFAIAAHLDPDVLIIDEVLSVGDFAFQERAFDRLSEVARSGIPVVVVSHQLDRIQALCNRALLLDHGVAVRQGTPAECIAEYVMPSAPVSAPANAPVHLLALDRGASAPIRSGERFDCRLRGEVVRAVSFEDVSVDVRVRSITTGKVVFAAGTSRHELRLPERGPFELNVSLQMNLPEGPYSLEWLVWDRPNGRDLAPGPVTVVEIVPGGSSFWGQAQLNAVMDVATPGGRSGRDQGAERGRFARKPTSEEIAS